MGDLSSCRAGQEVVFLCLKHVDPPFCEGVSASFWNGGTRKNLDAMGLDSPTASPHGGSNEGMEMSLASEWTRVEGTYGLLRPLHGENLVYIHRQTTHLASVMGFSQSSARFRPR